MNKNYFPHDYNARNDPKIINLMRKFGMAGVGIFWCIIEMLYEQNGEMQLDCERIAFELRTDATIVEKIIKSDLFFIKDEKFFSKSAKKRLKKITEKSEQAKENANKRWKNKQVTDNATALQPQSNSNANAMLLNKKKLNKIKDNNKGFSKPNLEEIKSYCLENNIKIDYEHFFNYYEANGWKVGKNQMKNWHAAIANWQRQNNKYNGTAKEEESELPIYLRHNIHGYK